MALRVALEQVSYPKELPSYLPLHRRAAVLPLHLSLLLLLVSEQAGLGCVVGRCVRLT